MLSPPPASWQSASRQGIPWPSPRSTARGFTFPARASAALRKGQLKGDQTIDYKLRAGAGQTLTVELKGSNLQNYFNVMAAGTDNALFIGSSSGNRFSGLLPSDGDVRVRVYLMRPEARRNETSIYSLKVRIGGTPLAPVPASRDALIPGTPITPRQKCPVGPVAAVRPPAARPP